MLMRAKNLDDAIRIAKLHCRGKLCTYREGNRRDGQLCDNKIECGVSLKCFKHCPMNCLCYIPGKRHKSRYSLGLKRMPKRDHNVVVVDDVDDQDRNEFQDEHHLVISDNIDISQCSETLKRLVVEENLKVFGTSDHTNGFLAMPARYFEVYANSNTSGSSFSSLSAKYGMVCARANIV
jgi:hypothetical protein